MVRFAVVPWGGDTWLLPWGEREARHLRRYVKTLGMECHGPIQALNLKHGH